MKLLPISAGTHLCQKLGLSLAASPPPLLFLASEETIFYVWERQKGIQTAKDFAKSSNFGLSFEGMSLECHLKVSLQHTVFICLTVKQLLE